MLEFTWYHFSELTNDLLYKILCIRSEIFVVEQECLYLDPDGKDTHALHLVGVKNNEIFAYLRLFLPSETQPYLSFGRVLTRANTRGKGYGKSLMHQLLSYADTRYPGRLIVCSAQARLQKFYNDLGFSVEGEAYLEDDMPHIKMVRGGRQTKQ